jgi:hypothetical protein
VIKEFPGEPGFIGQIFSLWLGKTSDSGLENLQKEILSPAS